MFSQLFTFVIQFGGITVLARLLIPEYFGLVAMVAALTNLAVLFSDMGLSAATIQRENISEQQVSNLFWINALIGLAIFMTVAGCAPLICIFYEEPRLTGIALALSISFFFGALSIQHQALLKRHMMFRRLAVVEIAAMLISTLFGIGSALLNAGYWALVFMQIMLPFSKMIGLWMACPWRPKCWTRGVGARELFNFGMNVTGFNLVNYFSRNLDKILLGRWHGSGPLGFYSNAYQLVLFPINKINGPITTAVLPALSRLQNDPDQYREYYKNALRIIAAAGTPLVFFLCLMADEVIFILLGDQWGQAVPIFRLLTPAAWCAVTNVATGWVYMSLGHVNRQLKWGIWASVFLCICMILGVRWGAWGMALAVSISRIIQKCPGLWYCYVGTPIKMRDFFYSCWPATLASLMAVVTAYLGLKILLWQGPLIRLLFSGVLFGMMYLLVLLGVTPDLRKELFAWVKRKKRMLSYRTF